MIEVVLTDRAIREHIKNDQLANVHPTMTSAGKEMQISDKRLVWIIQKIEKQTVTWITEAVIFKRTSLLSKIGQH